MSAILLTGCNGQVGAELAASLSRLGNVIACDRRALDLADADAIVAKMREIRPDIVVNAAAYTAVDRAQTEPELAHAVNATAPAILADEAARLGALLVHYSTDYVFDGTKTGPYTEEDVPNPLNAYGRSKLAGERAIQSSGAMHLIFRTSWVYGARGSNFLLTICRLAAERDELKIVDDQFGAPTWSRDIARATADVLTEWLGNADGATGLFHLSAAGRTSWCGFARVILDIMLPEKSHPRLVPIPSTDYPAPAQRPLNSVLSNSKLHAAFGIKMPEWDESLRACVDVIAAG